MRKRKGFIYLTTEKTVNLYDTGSEMIVTYLPGMVPGESRKSCYSTQYITGSVAWCQAGVWYSTTISQSHLDSYLVRGTFLEFITAEGIVQPEPVVGY
jgi:hypothetical protein